MRKLVLILGLLALAFGTARAAVIKVDENTIQVTLSADQKAKIAEVEAATGTKMAVVEPTYTVAKLKEMRANVAAQKVRQTAELTKAIKSCDDEIKRIDALLVEADKLGVKEVIPSE